MVKIYCIEYTEEDGLYIKRQLNELDVFGIIRKRFKNEETKQDKKYFIEEIYQLAQELECELVSEEEEE